MTNTDEAEYRHRTSDTWEAAFLWSQGHPLSHTEHEDRRVFFCFPVSTGLSDDLREYQLGRASANALNLKQGFYLMKRAVDAELNDAGIQ